MREYLFHILQCCPRQGQQIVADLHPRGTDNGKVVLIHQVVYTLHRTGGAVLDGQDTVAALSPFHCLKYSGKGGIEANIRGFKQLITYNLRVGPLDPLAGRHRPGWKERRGVLQRPPENVIHRGTCLDFSMLMGSAHRQQSLVQHLGIPGQLISRLPGHSGQQFPLPSGG